MKSKLEKRFEVTYKQEDTEGNDAIDDYRNDEGNFACVDAGIRASYQGLDGWLGNDLGKYLGREFIGRKFIFERNSPGDHVSPDAVKHIHGNSYSRYLKYN